MIAAELKPGQWFRFVDDPRPKLCTYSDQYLFVFTDGNELVSPSRNEIVEILPDCTGYDWEPPAKPKHYRPFASAEEFKPHRERWIVGKFEWDKATIRLARYAADTDWKHLLEQYIFDDDGSAVGIEVDDE